MTQTLEQYLRDELANCGAIDFTIRATVTDKRVSFYIHPSNRAGMTVDFLVDGNTLQSGDMCGVESSNAGTPLLGEDGALLAEPVERDGCKPGGCSSIGCEGGIYCFNADGSRKRAPEFCVAAALAASVAP